MFNKKLGLVLLLAVAVSLSLASVAVAQSSSQKVFKAKLDSLNRSGATANATLTLEGRRLTTRIESDDMAPKLPHAQHIHGFKQAVPDPGRRRQRRPSYKHGGRAALLRAHPGVLHHHG